MWAAAWLAAEPPETRAAALPSNRQDSRARLMLQSALGLRAGVRWELRGAGCGGRAHPNGVAIGSNKL